MMNGMAEQFIVALECRSMGGGGIKYTTEYFQIGPFYDPCNYRRLGGTQTSPDKQEAFQFTTRAAAEVVAALYCGKVECLTPADAGKDDSICDTNKYR